MDMATAAEELGALTPVERLLVEYVERGELLDLAGEQPVNEAAMRGWDMSRTIRAWVVRDIMRGRLATDPDPHGLRLRGARIAGRVDLEKIMSKIWLELSDCLLAEGLVANDAHLAGLVLSGCRLEHPHEPALHVARLTTAVLAVDSATVQGHSNDGAINAYWAHFGLLDCTDATLRNDSGPALNASGLKVDQSVSLCGGFEATGAGEFATVRLIAAHIGLLDCSDATLRNDSGPALNAGGLQVDQIVYLRGRFKATGAGDDVAVYLADARVNGVLVFNPAQLEHLTDPQARLNVDGLTYRQLPVGLSAGSWLKLLSEGTPDYAAQPYQQLAAAHRAAGHDSEARRILMEQRRNQIRRGAITERTERAWARITGLTLGYGYQPWRALIGLFAVVFIAVVLAVILGGHGGLMQTRTTSTSLGCTLVERISVGLDLGTPLITTGARARCDTTDTTTGQVLMATGWTLRLSAWAFATLFIAGFTSAVRKT
ncbi:MAG TPA: hypothetical protein VFV67_18935 [Actinophytocola sp.]|uniref:hypothetical protein n=1 Tax=Actinophytocola sp. TaxID=1872138 RepID=UPI002DB9DC95|nr:hypothetical protein [Actinophytocola sp.]HEU5472728.1 hypothetical protein [Actinophytocola sp.]